MVKLEYSALYTDNIGCEQAKVYFSKEGLQLIVRNCTFNDDNFSFDFYAKGLDGTQRLFYLKDNELIKYSIDIKLPVLLNYNDEHLIQEFLLQIERKKNYYNNSLSIISKDLICKVEGYDLQELLCKIKNKLPKEYKLENNNYYCLYGVFYLQIKKKNQLFSVEYADGKCKNSNINLSNKFDKEKAIIKEGCILPLLMVNTV